MTLHLRAAVQATNLIARALLAALRLAPMPPSEPPRAARPHDAFKQIRDADPLGWHHDSCELATQLAADREAAHPFDWQKWQRQMGPVAHGLAELLGVDS